jgi:hypothetical protein
MKHEKLDNNREIIKEYLVAGGAGIELSDKQKELLTRWEIADEKIRENMGKLTRSEIADIIKNTCNVSLCTAKSDMVNAEYVFSSSNPLNKAHRISMRIEFLEKQSRLASIAKDYKAVGMIERSIEKYIQQYPELTPVETPKTLIFNFDVDQIKDLLMPIDQAMLIGDMAIKKKEEEIGEYLDFEEEKGGTDEQ